MISVLFGKGLCSLGVHSVSVWEYLQEGVCTQDGVCRRCNAKCEQIEQTTEEKTAGEPKTPAIVVTSGRRAVEESPIAGLVARTAAVVMLVVAKSDGENSAIKRYELVL